MKTRYITMFASERHFPEPHKMREQERQGYINALFFWRGIAIVAMVCFLIAIHIGMKNLDMISQLSDDLSETRLELAQTKAAYEKEVAKNFQRAEGATTVSYNSNTTYDEPQLPDEGSTDFSQDDAEVPLGTEEIVVSSPETSAAVIVPAVYTEVVPLDDDLVEYIYESATDAGIDPAIMFSLAWKETTYQTDLISKTNDYGLFQINQTNFGWLAKTMGVSKSEMANLLMDPYFCTDCAIIMLSGIMDNDYESYHLVLMVYNMGGGGAQKLWKQGTYSSEYSRAIAKYASENFGLQTMSL